MRLDLGCPVRCTDDAFGELADVVIDPTTRRVTHLVVQPRRPSEPARLVPVDRARGGDEANGTIDTCLALLILKRANFAEELTRHLEGGLIKAKP